MNCHCNCKLKGYCNCHSLYLSDSCHVVVVKVMAADVMTMNGKSAATVKGGVVNISTKDGVHLNGLSKSKRFLRWVETWIEEDIPHGTSPDIESKEAKAKPLTEKLFSEAVISSLTTFETKEERERVPPM